jgi:hypothetical protein
VPDGAHPAAWVNLEYANIILNVINEQEEHEGAEGQQEHEVRRPYTFTHTHTHIQYTIYGYSHTRAHTRKIGKTAKFVISILSYKI